MLFTSPKFIVFFIVFFGLYWFVFAKNLKLQNLLVLLTSYLFYSMWDWRFLILLVGISVITFFLGLGIKRTRNDKRSKWLLVFGIVLVIGQLAFFKYFNFFISSFNKLLLTIGFTKSFDMLTLVLPIGISFYTFRIVSYLIDIYHEKIEPATNPIIYFTYVAFFPSLISGPIDKGSLLIPQLSKPRSFNYAQSVSGIRQILWGFFKKIVIADSCVALTNQIFSDYSIMPPIMLLLGAFLFTIQLYADFSGYSDMAIGFSKLIGFKVTKNFDFPFFAQNIAEFWRKWHISLTSWLTEYVFTPLNIAFRDYGKMGIILAILINFTIIGFWHGANWTFILFGVLHGLFYIPLIYNGTMFKSTKIKGKGIFPTKLEFMRILGTFLIVMFTLILFKSETVWDAFLFIKMIFSASIFSISHSFPVGVLILIFIFMTIEWFGRTGDFAIEKLRIPTFPRWSFYLVIFLLIFLKSGKQQEFVYFQF